MSVRWSFGSLKLIKNLVGNQIITFKRNLKEKLLPAIEEGDEDNLKKSWNILYNLMIFLDSSKPSLEELEHMNLRMSELSTIASEKPKNIEKIFSTLNKHPKYDNC